MREGLPVICVLGINLSVVPKSQLSGNTVVCVMLGGVMDAARVLSALRVPFLLQGADETGAGVTAAQAFLDHAEEGASAEAGTGGAA